VSNEQFRGILGFNAWYKYIEFVLGAFDQDSDQKTLGELRLEYHEKFQVKPSALLNQYFGLSRLLIICWMDEVNTNHGKPIRDDDVKSMKIIRNAVAHGDVESCPEGILFKNVKKGTEKFISYDDLVILTHKIENTFYEKSRFR